jgi:hypothetical protein
MDAVWRQARHLLLAPLITLVLVNLRSQPVESSRVELTPPAAVQEASGVEEASGVLPGAEEAFWEPYSSRSGVDFFSAEWSLRNGHTDEARHPFLLAALADGSYLVGLDRPGADGKVAGIDRDGHVVVYEFPGKPQGSRMVVADPTREDTAWLAAGDEVWRLNTCADGGAFIHSIIE